MAYAQISQSQINLSQNNSDYNSIGFFARVLYFFLKVAKVVDRFFGLIGAIILLIVLSPIILVALLLVTILYKRVANRLNSDKDFITVHIAEFSFDELKELEKSLKDYSIKIQETHNELVEIKDYSLIKPLLRHVSKCLEIGNDIRSIIKKQFSFKKEDIFDSIEEFEEHNKIFSCFDDVWSYENSDEDDKVVFSQKKKSSK